MNWSRGLLRIWIAFSVIWLFGWGIAGYVNWPALRPTAYIFSNDNHIRQIDGSDRDAIQEAEKRGLLNKKTTIDGDVIYWQADSSVMTDDARAKLLRDLRRREQNGEIRDYVIAFAIALVSLPALLLLAGLTVTWIINGFRAR